VNKIRTITALNSVGDGERLIVKTLKYLADIFFKRASKC
jgi:hypothetical protein